MKIRTLSVAGAEEIQRKFSLPSLSAKVLAAKGLGEEEIKRLLAPPKLADPFCAQGMREVAERIRLAKQREEKVLVCGDYDADGICATAIMVDALRRYGISCGFYIPNRFREGYGLHAHTVSMAHEKDYRLLITVDNGVKAQAALQQAKELGIDVIVTDHHAMDEPIECLQLLHPFQMGEVFRTLSGAGVALEIARALQADSKEQVVLACVAAIGDVMELRGETRAIVKLGLQYLKQGLCRPVQLLAKERYPRWDEGTIAYQIVPKLNVTGRLADMVNVNNTVRYLLLRQEEELQRVAVQISALNDRRKELSEEMLHTARTLVHEEYSFQLLFHDSFHEGMAGLVAGKLAEELKCPVMIAARNKDSFKGSIRSLDLLDLTTFFDECREELESYGGHKAAAGIGFSFDKKQFIQDYVNGRMKHTLFQKEKSYEVIEVSPSEITLSSVLALEELSPFGQGFEEPLFQVRCQVQDMKLMGKGEHAKWSISDVFEATYFHCREQLSALKEKKTLTFIGNLRINAFMGRKKVNIFVAEAY